MLYKGIYMGYSLKHSMGNKQASRYCAGCQGNTLAVGTTPNHVLHLVLTVLTIGFWGIVWILITLGKSGGYKCSKCGLGV